MKRKNIGRVLLALCLLLCLSGCVGGWKTTDGEDGQSTQGSTKDKGTDNTLEERETEKADEENHTSQELEKEEGTEVAVITYNTGTAGENLSFEVVREIGIKNDVRRTANSGEKCMVVKVTNNSDVCYKWVKTIMYFECYGLPNTGGEGQVDEYHSFQSYYTVPANSICYYVVSAPGLEQSVEKGAAMDGMIYYDFDASSDSYRFEILDYQVSDIRIQDASAYLTTETAFEKSNNQLGTITNTSNRIVQYTGFVIYDDSDLGDLVNGESSCVVGELHLESIVPPYNTTYSRPDKFPYDLNTIYTDRYDMDISSYQSCEIFIASAWFVDESITQSEDVRENMIVDEN